MTRHTRLLGHALGPAWEWAVAAAIVGLAAVAWWVG